MRIDFLYNDAQFYRYALFLTRDANNAKDLIQDVALKMLVRNYDEQQTGLKKIAKVAIRNTFLDYLSRSKGKSGKGLLCRYGNVQLFEDAAITFDYIEEKLDKKYRVSILKQKVKQRNADDSLIFTMYLEGYKFTEIQEYFPEKPLNTLLGSVRYTKKYLINNIK